MRHYIYLVIFLFSFQLKAQNHTYLGAETGLPFEIFRGSNLGEFNNKAFFYSPMFGFTLGQEFHQYFTLETGVYRDYNGESTGFKNHFGTMMTNSFDAWQIPLRFRARWGLLQDKIRLSGTIGASYVINSDYGSTSFGWGSVYDKDTISYYDFSDNRLKPAFILAEVGAAVEFKISNSLLLSLSSSYYKGFSEVIHREITYQVSNSAPHTATLSSYGDYYNFMIGLRYALDRLWRKEKS